MATFSDNARAGYGHTNGDVNGIVNGYTNGLSNGHTNGLSNGYADHGFSKKHADSLSPNPAANAPRAQLFLLSAFEESTGKRQATSLLQYLRDRLDRVDRQFLADLAFTLGERRSQLPWKSAVVASSNENLIQKLEDSTLKFTRATAVPGLAFVFTGQGAQWHAMGRELIKAYPVFANTLRRIGSYLKIIGASWDVIGMLLPI